MMNMSWWRGGSCVLAAGMEMLNLALWRKSCMDVRRVGSRYGVFCDLTARNGVAEPPSNWWSVMLARCIFPTVSCLRRWPMRCWI
jgi:hypothetical protein